MRYHLRIFVAVAMGAILGALLASCVSYRSTNGPRGDERLDVTWPWPLQQGPCPPKAP